MQGEKENEKKNMERIIKRIWDKEVDEWMKNGKKRQHSLAC